MMVDYLLYQPSIDIQGVAVWMEQLLPESWLQPIYTFNKPTQYSTLYSTQRSIPHLKFLLGRTLLYRRLTLMGYDYVNLPKMYYTESGKPFFKTPLYFNLAYTKGIVLLAFSTKTEVGIDVERIRPISWASFETYFEHEAWKTIAKDDYPTKALINYWVIKEAATKLKGVGLDFPHEKVRFDSNRVILDKSVYYHQKLSLPPVFIAQVVTKEKQGIIKAQNVTPQISQSLYVVRA